MNPSSQRIQTACTACELHEHCYTVGMNPIGPENAPLMVFLDCPPAEDDMRHKFGESHVAKFVRWMMNRNGLKEEEYRVAFTLKCSIPKKTITKKVQKYEVIDACTPHRIASLQNCKCALVMGELSVLAFLDQPLKKTVNCIWPSQEIKGLSVAVSYAPGYALQNPSQSVGMARLMWLAAEKAGLKPYFNAEAGQFDYHIF